MLIKRNKKYIALGSLILILVAIPLIIFFIRSSNGIKKQGATYTKPYHNEPNVNLTLSREELLDTKISQANFSTDSEAKTIIEKNAVDSGTIFVTDTCTIEPVVTKLGQPPVFNFINQSKTQQSFVINSKNYSLSPSQALQVTDLASAVQSVTKILCQGKVAGYIYIEQ